MKEHTDISLLQNQVGHWNFEMTLPQDSLSVKILMQSMRSKLSSSYLLVVSLPLEIEAIVRS